MLSTQNIGFPLTLRELCGKTSQIHSQMGTKMESSLIHGLAPARGLPCLKNMKNKNIEIIRKCTKINNVCKENETRDLGALDK